jgi:hypothetical protein
MIVSSRAVAVFGSVLAIAVAVGCGTAKSDAKQEAPSPCGKATAPTWSPDGTQIAWYGYRWPLPSNRHAVGSYNVLRAVCVSDAEGKHLHPLADTVCSEHCSNPLSDPPGQLDWVAPTLLLAADDLGIFAVPVGQKPKLLGKAGPVPFSVDAGGDRVASGVVASCLSCPGPVTIRSVPSGGVVGLVGGNKLENSEPSLSPDGTQVVFARMPAKDSGRPGIWTASVDGSHLKLLEKRGSSPLWSPAGNEIAYLAPIGASRYAWRLVAPQGGASTTLLGDDGPGTVFGWSPNGRWIAFPDSKGRLAVINVATKKVRRLLPLRLPYDLSSVVWSPNSQQLLAVWRPPAHTHCPSGLWRVPIDGAKPQLVHGC